LPDRPIFVGENVPAKFHWYFRAEPAQDPVFTVPLVGLDTVTVGGPPLARNTKHVTLTSGSKDLDLPYEVGEATLDGLQYNRLTATLFVTPRSIPPGGKLEVPASTVIGALRVGRPDFFGRAEARIFRAVDSA